MKFKSISKNNVGILIILLLTVVLSQARFFNFMVNSALGRTLLIAILLILSYIHKILGVICVFLIIIMFNNSDIPYLEGFTPTTTSEAEKQAEREKVRDNVKARLAASTPASTTTTPASTTTTPASTTTTPASSTTPASTTTTPASSSPASTSSSVAATASSAPTTESPAVSTPATVTPSQTAAAQSAAQSAISQLNTEFFGNMKAKEGFDIVGKERNIQKGRNSNSIPVNDFMRESTNVAPYEGSLFSESFSSY